MERKINYREIGDKIRIEREKFDISREKFAELLDLSPFFIGQIERGERKMSISTLINVSECLHISIDYLIFGKVHKVQENNSLRELINKCSEKEAKVIEEITKAILPHIVR
ncbi:helix-turn-helix domain-containing protein [Clostridium vincentii]|uniref:Anaerobic benzoate catabolism transcriptional regulator n=1 Tax=Clostridium vincentii TaxID=52704 RepID=A0A2T0BIB5_9CLOT|nr:helix-turn-helix transcriptional regulator [Clostridium vincentii]PRR83636.1 anaerobic benzoate catabolism transcriptional regulator [Clostridium vincentii]